MAETNKKAQKRLFQVKSEVLIPATIIHRVMAEDEKSALLEVERISAQKVSQTFHHNRKIKLKATIYKPGTTTVIYTKTYRAI